MENFKQNLKIYQSRIYNLIKESNEIVSMGYQLGKDVNRPEFESFNNFGFVCRGTSSLKKYDPKYFKIRGLGISENRIFSIPFLIYLDNNDEINVEITEKQFKDYGFEDFSNFEKTFETFEKKFYEYIDNYLK